jgi:hypothetical protein
MEASRIVNSYPGKSWLLLYREAILEPDPQKAKLRIHEAQTAIGRRARELWYARVLDTNERRQMDAAAQLLGILRTIGEHT